MQSKFLVVYSYFYNYSVTFLTSIWVGSEYSYDLVMSRVPKKRVFVPIWKKCHKTICSIEIFRFLTFPLLSFKIPISASVLPVFWAFPVLGPIITSLTIVREAIMMGPWTGNAQKTGKTRRKWVFFNSTMEIVRNLKISMLQLAISLVHFV